MPSKTKQGFTLIELLIVIAIIGILMGILIPTISMIRKNGKLTETKDLRNQITAALQEYQTAYREYPPSSIPKGAQKPLSELNDINVGIEFCVTYLATPYRGSSFLTPSDKMLTNTDADKVSTKFAPWSYESKELFEFLYLHQQPGLRPGNEGHECEKRDHQGQGVSV